MRIEELHLENFRGFQNLTLKLPSNLAVFIGVNGSGKSSILDSIAILISEFIYQLCKVAEGFSEFELTVDDISINSETTRNSILVDIDSDRKLSWEIFIDRDRSSKEIRDYFSQIRQYTQEMINYTSELIDKLKNNSNLGLPILAYYQTQRIVIKSSRSSNNSRNYIKYNQLDAYKTAFLNKINDFQEFLDWFKEEEDFENEVRLRQDNSFRNPKLEIVRKVIEKFLEGFPDTQFFDLRVARSLTRVSVSSRHYSDRAIGPVLVIKKNGQDLKLDQLSDGEKTLLMLVVDIARRLAILNPGIIDAAELLEKGTGIILIDEVDLHLHPQWQRIVLSSFTRTFPNCQFIVTTHSPQVLSGVNRENVFILEDSQIVEDTPHTFGRDTNSILFEVMGVEKRPVQMQERLDKCFEMIDNENIEAAKLELKKLSELLGNNDPEIVQAYTLIDFLNRVE